MRHQSIDTAIRGAIKVTAEHDRHVFHIPIQTQGNLRPDVLNVEEAEIELQQSNVIGIGMEVEMGVGNAQNLVRVVGSQSGDLNGRRSDRNAFGQLRIGADRRPEISE